MKQQETQKRLLEAWVVASQELLECLTRNQVESIVPLLDARDSIMNRYESAGNEETIPKELWEKAKLLEKQVHDMFNYKLSELKKEMAGINHHRRFQSYEPQNYETNMLDFHK